MSGSSIEKEWAWWPREWARATTTSNNNDSQKWMSTTNTVRGETQASVRKLWWNEPDTRFYVRKSGLTKFVGATSWLEQLNCDSCVRGETQASDKKLGWIVQHKFLCAKHRPQTSKSFLLGRSGLAWSILVIFDLLVIHSLHYLGIYLNILLNISNRYHHHEYSLWIDSREVGRPQLG